MPPFDDLIEASRYLQARQDEDALAIQRIQEEQLRVLEQNNQLNTEKIGQLKRHASYMFTESMRQLSQEEEVNEVNTESIRVLKRKLSNNWMDRDSFYPFQTTAVNLVPPPYVAAANVASSLAVEVDSDSDVDIIEERTLLACRYDTRCKSVFNTTTSRDRHEQEAHPRVGDKNGYRCPTCRLLFTNIRMYQLLHKDSHPPRSKNGTRSRILIT